MLLESLFSAKFWRYMSSEYVLGVRGDRPFRSIPHMDSVRRDRF